MEISCIYYIENILNSKKYIGTTKDLKECIYSHNQKFVGNRNTKFLQEDYNKYGKDNFRICIIEVIDCKAPNIYFIERANYWMDYYKDNVYNVNKASKCEINLSYSKVINHIMKFTEMVVDIKMEKKEIAKLVKLYFDFNPHMNRGIAFKAKANDIISSYANTHKKSYEEIKDCIEKSPMCQQPIWAQFNDYFNKKKVEKSDYKDSISDSTNPDDWL